MERRNLWIIGAVLIILILGFVAINNKSGDGDTIKIGSILILSGQGASWGISE